MLSAPARKPILKRTAPCAQDFCPKPVGKQMEVESPYDPPAFTAGADLSGRKTSIEGYNQREEGMDYPVKKARYTFSASEVLHFDLLESTISNPVCIEPVKEENPLGPFASRALDRLICNREFAAKTGRPLPFKVELILNSELEKYNTFTNETKTTEEIKAVALEQAQDLLERCEQRLAALPPTAQINPRTEMKKATAKWSAEEEADYHEKLLTRVPDVLTQCFLPKRVITKVPGLDANANTLSVLRDSIIPGLMG
jgi:hypothetical protein